MKKGTLSILLVLFIACMAMAVTVPSHGRGGLPLPLTTRSTTPITNEDTLGTLTPDKGFIEEMLSPGRREIEALRHGRDF